MTFKSEQMRFAGATGPIGGTTQLNKRVLADRALAVTSTADGLQVIVHLDNGHQIEFTGDAANQVLANEAEEPEKQPAD